MFNERQIGHIDQFARSIPPSDESAWTTRGLRKSGQDYDEIECQRAIAGFMVERLGWSPLAE
jgi:hypothetical protein